MRGYRCNSLTRQDVGHHFGEDGVARVEDDVAEEEGWVRNLGRGGRSVITGNEFRPGLDVLRGLEDNVSAGDLSEAADVVVVAIISAVEEPHPVAPPVAAPGQPRLVHNLVVASAMNAANLNGTGKRMRKVSRG